MSIPPPIRPRLLLAVLGLAVLAAGLAPAPPAGAVLGDCGEVVAGGDGRPSANDALGILKSAVTPGTPCPPPAPGEFPLCLCDVDASGKVTASDALNVLRAAVRLEAVIACDCGSTTTTTSTTSTSTTSTTSTTLAPTTTTSSSTTTSSTTTTSTSTTTTGVVATTTTSTTTTTMAPPQGQCRDRGQFVGATCTANADCPTQTCFRLQFRTCSISRKPCLSAADCRVTCDFP
jgi:hypothetical protein